MFVVVAVGCAGHQGPPTLQQFQTWCEEKRNDWGGWKTACFAAGEAFIQEEKAQYSGPRAPLDRALAAKYLALSCELVGPTGGPNTPCYLLVKHGLGSDERIVEIGDIICNKRPGGWREVCVGLLAAAERMGNTEVAARTRARIAGMDEPSFASPASRAQEDADRAEREAAREEREAQREAQRAADAEEAHRQMMRTMQDAFSQSQATLAQDQANWGAAHAEAQRMVETRTAARTKPASIVTVTEPPRTPPPRLPVPPPTPVQAPVPASETQKEKLDACLRGMAPETITERAAGFGVAEGALNGALQIATACEERNWASCAPKVREAFTNARGGGDLGGFAADVERVLKRKMSLPFGPWTSGAPTCSASGEELRQVSFWCWETGGTKANCTRQLQSGLSTISCATTLSHWVDHAEDQASYDKYKKDYAAKCRAKLE